MRNYVWILLTAALVLVLGMVLLDKAGQSLIMDHPASADVIVVLAGDRNDRRFFRGLELLRDGYAPRMLVDANSDMIFFGRTPAVREDQMIRSLELKGNQVQVCPTQAIQLMKRPGMSRNVYTMIKSGASC